MGEVVTFQSQSTTKESNVQRALRKLTEETSVKVDELRRSVKILLEINNALTEIIVEGVDEEKADHLKKLNFALNFCFRDGRGYRTLT